MVRQLAVKLARELELGQLDQVVVDLCAQVRDVGMIALPDRVVHATGPLAPGDWDVLNRHPALGGDLLASLPATGGLAAIVRSHHERWDGEGYPDGLSADAIPMLSRVIAVCDAFVSIAADRPHRRGVGAEAALEHVREQRGTQFEPRAVDALVAVLTERSAGANGDRGLHGRPPPAGAQPAPATRVGDAIGRFDALPAFEPAVRQALAALSADGAGRGELIASIESDQGLTVAVLRRAQAPRRRISSVVDAVAALEPAEIREALAQVPSAAFPWRTPLEEAMHRGRVHAQAVARAIERIALEIDHKAADELVAAALLHDVGKLVLARVAGTGTDERAPATETPEDRVQRERRRFGVDHASVGALLLERWGLPPRLVGGVAGHHRSRDASELATVVRLADLVAHQAHGDPVNRRLMLDLAQSCGITVEVLRDVLFGLPRAGGSRRGRAESSPLSPRETQLLQLLAEGKVYKQIAAEKGLSPSTVRTHLHNAYAKLEVGDRAQAVLRATERGWI